MTDINGRPFLEWYDRATESEAANRQRVERSRRMRELALWRLHQDGATIRHIAAMTNLSYGTAHALIQRGKAHAVSLESQ